MTVTPSQINPDTLFGFAVNTARTPTEEEYSDMVTARPPTFERPDRPRKPKRPDVKPNKSAAPPAPVLNDPLPTSAYDPFDFQQRRQRPNAARAQGDKAVLSLDELRDLEYSDDQIFGGLNDAEGSHSQVTPDVLLPPLTRRQPKSTDGFGLRDDLISTNSIFDDSSDDKEQQLRRNMLMNIILRPGGGDKRRALPRPRVDVRTEGANVIVIRMTFPSNENIQGLRAFSPVAEEGAFVGAGDLLLPAATRNVRSFVRPPRVEDEKDDQVTSPTGTLELSFGDRQDPNSSRVKKDSPDGVGSVDEAPVEFGARTHSRRNRKRKEEDLESLTNQSRFNPPAKLEMFNRDEVVIPSILPKHPPLQLQPHLYNRPAGVPPPPNVRRPKLILAEERPPKQQRRRRQQNQRIRRLNGRFRQSRGL